VSLDEALAKEYPNLVVTLQTGDRQKLVDIWKHFCLVDYTDAFASLEIEQVHMVVGIWADKERRAAKIRHKRARCTRTRTIEQTRLDYLDAFTT
jgi:hypothetical protein